MKKHAIALLTLLCALRAPAQLPSAGSGTVQRFENFPSRYVAARNVDVWLPDGYTARKRYAVLYMHDGQMLFDSMRNWNGQEWQVDETAGRLLRERKIRDVIVVGIWNTGLSRHTEYFPQKAFEALPLPLRDSLYKKFGSGENDLFYRKQVQSDAYLKFLVEELKPFVDSVFTTRKERENTFIAGSSMGGLISMYAICEYPEVFGGAACLSTHWPGLFVAEDNPVPQAILAYLQSRLPDPKTHRFYFDLGSVELESWYPPFQKQADEILRAGGYSRKNWQTRVFPGENHSERAWAKRLEIPLVFLLGR